MSRTPSAPTARRRLTAAGLALAAAAATATASATATAASTTAASTTAASTTAASTTAATTGGAVTGTLLRSTGGLYPRLVRLEHSGTANGRVLASVVTFANGNGLGAVYESTDGGATFTQIGTIADPAAADNRGLCCGTLYEVPQQVGQTPAGTLLWAASVGARVTDRRMAIRVWRSADHGHTWSYLSSCAVAPNTGGLWEPEFSVDAAGELVCHFSDETQQPAHSQVLARVASTDGGLTWGPKTNTVTGGQSSDRPGMATVRRLPGGRYFMSYEICPVAGTYGCAAYYRTSADGWNWGSPTDPGTRAQTVDGRYFAHAPTVAWTPSSDPRGRLLLVGQILSNPDGSPAADNGRTVLVNTENGAGHWYEITAPVAVDAPYNNFCPNYSSALLPSADGTRVLEVATAYDTDGVCKPFYASGSTVGTGDATGVVSGATYRLVNVQSGLCLDVESDSLAAGANVRQWTCDGSGAQEWTVTSVGGGYVTLRGRDSGMCLDVTGDSTTPGANVQQWTCNGTGGQSWRPANVGTSYYTLSGMDSGLCLDDAGGSTTPGANVQQWTCNGLAPQDWRLEPR